MKVKLGELTKIRTGKLDANAASEDGTYPFFTCSKEPLRISTYSYDCECVLVAGNGDLNAKYYNGKFDAYQRTYIIESNGDGRLHLPYLYHFMTRYIQELRKLSIGGVIKYIKLGNLTDAEISLPSIKEQKDACEKLKKVKNIIDKKEAQIYYLDNLIKARFVEMFGNNKYETRIIKDVLCESFWLMPATPKYIDEGIPYITSKNIKNRILDLDDTKFISENDYVKISKNRPIKPGDILVSMIGTLGQTAVVSKDKRFYGQNIYLLRLNNDIISTSFFCEFFNSDDVQNKLAGKSNKSTQAYLKANHVEDLSIPIPPIAVQNDFATFVAQVDKSKFVLSNELTMCDFYIRLIHDRVMHSRINLRVAQ